MDTNESRNVESPIPGIYNYCDRWCERCPFTSRCENFAASEGGAGDSDSSDLENASFWNGLGAILNSSIEMLERLLAEKGIDPSTLPSREEQLAGAPRPEDHDLSRAAWAYLEAVNRWQESAAAVFESKNAELETLESLDLPGADPLGTAIQITDAIAVIRFDQLLIRTKVLRAVDAIEFDRTLDADADAAIPRDSDGSAKVALISLDRSIASWVVLREQLPAEEKPILGLLVHLARLRREIESQFPAARSFVRPGFDDTDC